MLYRITKRSPHKTRTAQPQGSNTPFAIAIGTSCIIQLVRVAFVES